MARSERKRLGDLPADHHAGEHVDDEGGVDPAGVRLDVGQVGHPEPVGLVGAEAGARRGRPGRCWRSSKRVVTL